MTNQTHQTSFTDIQQTELDIKQTVFNIEKTDYYTPKLFSGQPPGVFNTLNTSHPQIEKLFKKQKAQDWDEQETLENSDAKILFKTLPEDHNEPMIRTLGLLS